MVWRSIGEKLQNYISNLDEEEFKRALLFLRRAFADFTSNEKHDIAENIAEIWGLNKNDVSAVINDDLGENEKEIIAGLEEFDFDDIWLKIIFWKKNWKIR